jgi:hypothetical protein
LTLAKIEEAAREVAEILPAKIVMKSRAPRSINLVSGAGDAPENRKNIGNYRVLADSTVKGYPAVQIYLSRFTGPDLPVQIYRSRRARKASD